jgi:molybdopterin synthase catalytic subunit
MTMQGDGDVDHRIRIRVQQEDFDLSTEVTALRSRDPGVGAVSTFVGTVRDSGDGQPLRSLELEHYPGMTERSMTAMAEAALERFDIRALSIIHRVGALGPQEQIVLVAVSAAHRGEAFLACEYLMDFLKTQAPFWKKEIQADGSAGWVDARVCDEAATRRWSISPEAPQG